MITKTSIATFAVLSVISSPLLAQERTPSTVDELLDCFVARKAQEDFRGCEDVEPGALAVLTLPDKYPAYIGPLLDGLHDIALNNGSLRVRVAATLGLISSGYREGAAIPGIPGRVRHLYDESPDPVVRETLVQWSAYLADESGAIAFLEHVARADRSRGRMFPEEALALEALARLGPAGQAALASLDATSLRSEAAKQHLRHLAKNGFLPSSKEP